MKSFLVAVLVFSMTNSCFSQAYKSYQKNHPGAFEKTRQAYAKYKEEDYISTIKLCQEGILLDGKNDYLYYLSGRAKEFIGKREEALLDYNKSIELNSTDCDYYCNRAQLEDILDKNYEAFNDYEKAMKLTHDSDDLWNIYYSRACLKVKLLDWQGALSDCNKSLLYNKTDNALAFALRGEIKVEINDYMGAIKDCDVSIQISPGWNGLVYYTRGLAKAKINNIESACKDFEQAQKLTQDYRIKRAIEKYCK